MVSTITPHSYTDWDFLLEYPRAVSLPDNPHLKVDLLPKQTSAVAWLYKVKRGLIADPVGSGKTIVSLSLITLLKATGKPYRAIVFAMNFSSQLQWQREIEEKTDLVVLSVDGSPSARASQYAEHWDVLIVRYSTLLRDAETLNTINADVLIMDEPSAPSVGGHHHKTRTAKSLKRLAHGYERVVLLDATPMQSSPLLDFHSLFEIFAPNVFPPLPTFDARYVRREWFEGKGRRGFYKDSRIIGYRNMEEFKAIVRPYYMRRHDTEGMPDIQTITEYLPLHAEQRRYYNKARADLTSELTNDTGSIGQVKAGWHSLQYACDTTLPFTDKPPQSSKVDWLLRHIRYGCAATDKIVVFSRYKVGIQHIAMRLQEAGIPVLRLTGDETNEDKARSYDLFREPESGYNVLIGTSTLERALNLQVAKYLIAFNQIYNPSRMTQLAGRLRRRFSKHNTIFMVNLLTEGTMEAGLYARMQKLAALPDYVFGEQSDLFESLSREEMLELLGI